MHNHNHFEGFLDPTPWAFFLGMVGGLLLLRHAEVAGWFSLQDTGTVVGLVSGSVLAGASEYLKTRLRKKDACTHAHDHPHHDHDHHTH